MHIYLIAHQTHLHQSQERQSLCCLRLSCFTIGRNLTSYYMNALVNSVRYLWYNTSFMFNVLAQSGCLLSNAVTTQSVDLVFDGQGFGLLVLISFM